MSWNPYERPIPDFDCLTSEPILIQAWKKSSQYIRNCNWYADVLELDCSAAQLQQDIVRWQEDCEKGKFKPAGMHLVPAPKCYPWEMFSKKEINKNGDSYPWRPAWEKSTKAKEGKRPYLRPLAHLALRDQVFATACMICVADAVETEQGNCSLPTDEARKKNVSSYGNRLFCEWTTSLSRDTASFNWGNANCYRKYSTDYQAFLQRPKDVMSQAIHQLETGWELGVVSLDLSGFYDNIDRRKILEKLQELHESNEAPPSESEELFWKSLKSVFSWSWAEQDVSDDSKGLFKNGKVPNSGIPQGLVASGFFSNVVMLDFDAAMRKVILKHAIQGTSSRSIQVLDYCRYVDDLRVVVKWKKDEKNTRETIGKRVKNNVTSLLKKYSKGQECNQDKTKYASHEELSSENSPAAVMNWIQERHSGPSSFEELRETILALNGLLQMDHGQPKSSDALLLGSILRAGHEVRDDTIKRFAAYRKRVALQKQREMAPLEANDNEQQKIDSEIDSTARRLIYEWSIDPSMTIVLRHAFNLKPAPELLTPVLEAIDTWITTTKENQDKNDEAIPDEMKSLAQHVCCYTLAELLKAALIETGKNCNNDTLPVSADLDGYLETLADYTENLLQNENITLPWYVLQQAVMFLCQQGRPPLLKYMPDKRQMLQCHRQLVHVCRGTLHHIAKPDYFLISLLVIANQLGVSSSATVSRLAACLDKPNITEDEKIDILRQLYFAAPSIYDELLFRQASRQSPSQWYEQALNHIAAPPSKDNVIAGIKAKSLSLSHIMAMKDNPFRHEPAVLHLLRELAKHISNKPISPNQVVCKLRKGVTGGWENLRKPHQPVLEIDIKKNEPLDERYEYPEWLEKLPDRKWGRKWKMNIGRLLRAAITGQCDFTAMQYWHGSQFENNKYRGIKTSWYKRAHGLFNGDLCLTEGEATITPWFSELLTGLLRWPGSREMPWLLPSSNAIKTPDQLSELAESRLQKHSESWGISIDAPVYRHPVRIELKKPEKLTVCLVQTVRPLRDDFIKYSKRLDDPKYKHLRRNHLASMLGLTLKQLTVRETYGESRMADLVILPEFAVHQDDIDLIERFSDKAKAMVFCGLGLQDHPKTNGLVNSGLWIIPNLDAFGKRSFLTIPQGKNYPAELEKHYGIDSWRPCQQIIEMHHNLHQKPFCISAAMCYDATDTALAHDLRNVSDMLIVSANNKDVDTFDRMASAWSYHMYQHMLIVNTGEFGGTFAAIPHNNRHERILVHNHGGKHASVSIIELDLGVYANQKIRESCAELKTPPAGYKRHP